MIFRKFLSQRTVMPYSATPPKPGHDAVVEPLVEARHIADRRNGCRLAVAATPEISAGSGSILSPSIAATKWPSFIR